jgi:hypothetical protein
MADERTEISTGALARWAVVGVLLLAAIGAFFAWAPGGPVILAPQGVELGE